jgi:hypothetical protein
MPLENAEDESRRFLKLIMNKRLYSHGFQVKPRGAEVLCKWLCHLCSVPELLTSKRVLMVVFL